MSRVGRIEAVCSDCVQGRYLSLTFFIYEVNLFVISVCVPAAIHNESLLIAHVFKMHKAAISKIGLLMY